MPYYFSAFQIADMASQIEDRGAQFYSKLAASTKDKKTKKILIELSNQEKEHKDTFSQIAAEEKKSSDQAEYVIDLSKQLENDMSEIASIYNSEIFSRKKEDLVTALDFAIRLERESIRVYRIMQNTFTDKFKSVFEKIILQENTHLKILLETKSGLTDQNLPAGTTF